MHFPDGIDRVHTVSLPYLASRGTELMAGWVVEEIVERDDDELPYEAWSWPTRNAVRLSRP